MLRLDQGLSWDEVAEVMAEAGEPVTPATLSKRFERIKAKLAKLAREDGLLDDSSQPPPGPRDPEDPRGPRRG